MNGWLKLDPITLPARPTCDNCVTSSDDELAVACGSTVYILSPKVEATAQDPGVYSYWHINPVRVNVFSESEWPIQNLSSTVDLSIGEEQSESSAVRIKWSPPELGIHKRSVLGILTSNLVLSLWETDRLAGQYRRTCVINKFLSPCVTGSETSDLARRSRRVRAFTWLPSLKKESSLVGKAHYLITADDNCTVTVLNISKPTHTQSQTWMIAVAHQISLEGNLPPVIDLGCMSSLQRRLFEGSAISGIEHSTWRVESPRPEQDDLRLFSTNLLVSKGRLRSTIALSLHAIKDGGKTVELDNADSTSHLHPRLESEIHPSEVLERSEKLTNTTAGFQTVQETFQEALHDVANAFDEEYGLGGRHRVRVWGTTNVFNTNNRVACITLHPSDMIEHTTPASERCILIFKQSGEPAAMARVDSFSESDIHKKIIAFVIVLLQRGVQADGATDEQILNNMKALAQTWNHPTDTTDDNQVLPKSPHWGMPQTAASPLSESGFIQILTAAANDFSKASAALGNTTSVEICEMCSAPISFSSDTASATCRNGHQFTRCSLSFLAIQEPGISKYCSSCSRQFLDLAKRGMPKGPSFAHALFDEFDVCPYCQAKFRG